ncbi:Organic cation transporter 1 [Orchesella cincta]|uniref:Organic cation transporter 1 n=1 Tax=Orchesella cincta TaxID=48709 RepID=A0A1D2MNV2_ORCCI|nr:Organic cation transporter 1 [Orchesella cincta]
MLDFDGMLMHVGEFGLYQKILFTFQAPFCIFVTFVLFGQVFMTLYPMNYWCEEHFECLTYESRISAAQRRNLSFVWRNGGLFSNDPCELNNIKDDFLNRLERYEETTCPANISLPCNYNDSNSQWVPPSRRGSLKPTEEPPLIPVPPRLQVQSEPESRRRKKRQYTYGGGNRWSTRTTTRPTTTTEEPEEPGYDKYGGNGGDSYSSSGYGGRQSVYGNQGNGGGYQGNGGDSGGGYGSSGSSSYGSSGSSGYGKPGQEYGRNPGQGSQGTRRPGTGQGSTGIGDSGSTSSPLSTPNRGSGDRRPLTPSTSAFVGYPEPKCNRQRVRIDLRNNFFIHADTMRRMHRPSRFANVEAHNCTIRWNRTDPPFYETVVTDGNWWCTAEAYTTIAQAVFFLGAIVGGFLIGWIADTFGRVPALVIANILGAVGGALSAWSTNIWLFSLCRFITGMAFDNCFTMMYILVLEFCGPTYRTLVANLSIAIFYTLGTILLPFLAQLIGNWRIYALVISLPMLLALLALFFVPESARWLLSKGRAKEATKILRSFAKVNRRKVDEQIFVEFEVLNETQEATKLFSELEASAEEEPSLFVAFKTPRLRRTFILLTLIWALIALVYDGHSRNIINLANDELNVFWMFGIASLTEFPADMLLIFTLDRFGRRWLAFGSMTLSGAFSFISAAITPDVRAAFLVSAIISRFWVNVAFNIGLQYAAELLPTVIRAQGVNAIHIMGYVASIISPFVAAIGRTNPALSLILLGAFAITAGFLSLFLAETLGEELPNTLEEAEAFGKNQSFFNCPICSKEREDDVVGVAPSAVEDNPVVLRNALRGSIRGATYRSSLISQSSSGGSSRKSFRPGAGVSHAPEPTEMTRLRRGYTH